MFETLAIVFGVLLVVSLLPLVWIALRKALNERGPRVITCPENGCHAEVEVGALRSGLTFAFGETRRRLTSCSRWPEMEGCDQACLAEIETTPGGCLVRSLVADWYNGRTCAYCGTAIPEIHASDRKPGLRTPDGRNLALADIAPVDLETAFAADQAVCANCYDAMSFREYHPGLAVERPQPLTRKAS